MCTAQRVSHGVCVAQPSPAPCGVEGVPQHILAWWWAWVSYGRWCGIMGRSEAQAERALADKVMVCGGYGVRRGGCVIGARPKPSVR